MVIMSTQTHRHKKDKEGFVILVAVLVATVVVALGAFIAAIAVKELELSSSGRESQDAFYAADAALECALYHDFHVEQFGSNIADPAGVSCNSSTPSPVIIRDVNFGQANQAPSNQNNSVSYFKLVFSNGNQPDDALWPMALVKVRKFDVGSITDKTVIEAQGYNVSDPTLPGRVQRALQVVY